uniref:Putative 8.9 kDa family member n=1 Tax=Rhipicephalus pulchellus TaxID=72859 RepID=L7M9A3_RHIPC
MSASLCVLLLLMSTCTASIHRFDTCHYNGTTLPTGRVKYFHETCEKGWCSFGYGIVHRCDNKKPRPYCHLERVKGNFPRCCRWVHVC